jgi:hypothetical protein
MKTANNPHPLETTNDEHEAYTIGEWQVVSLNQSDTAGLLHLILYLYKRQPPRFTQSDKLELRTRPDPLGTWRMS